MIILKINLNIKLNIKINMKSNLNTNLNHNNRPIWTTTWSCGAHSLKGSTRSTSLTAEQSTQAKHIMKSNSHKRRISSKPQLNTPQQLLQRETTASSWPTWPNSITACHMTA